MNKSVISLNELRHDTVLPCAIYDALDPELLLLNRGITITKEILESLHKRGINRIAVDSEHLETIQVASRNKISNKRKIQALQELRPEASRQANALSNKLKKPESPLYDDSLVTRFASANQQHCNQVDDFLASIKYEPPEKIRCDCLLSITRESIGHLLGDIDLFAKLAIESSKTKAQNEHCLKTAKLAMSMATILEFNKEEISQLGIGCMMSRIGIDPEIQTLFEIPRKFTALESLEMKKHASRKLRLLEQIPGIPLGAKQVAWQIHERWNGSGYPRGRSTNQIPPLVRVASVADAYVAMVSDRSYRKAMSAYKAVVTILHETSKGLFEPNSVRGLMRTISLFPLGSYVELSNNTIAVSKRNHSRLYDKPIVEVVCDSLGLPSQHSIINLSQEEDVEIIRTVATSDLDNLLRKTKQQQVRSPQNQKATSDLVSS